MFTEIRMVTSMRISLAKTLFYLYFFVFLSF